MSRWKLSAVGKSATVIGLLTVVSSCQPRTIAPSRTPTSTPTVTSSVVAACPSRVASTAPEVLAQKLPAPDDLAFGLDQRLLFSDLKAGTVSALNADGSVERIASGLSAPEGILPQGAKVGSGPLLVAEQGRNRVVSIDPQSHAVRLWRPFPNKTGTEGIDGIGPELANGDIVVPDSPNGVVWRVSGDGRTATQIASGMGRPVGAALDAAGRIFVADEGGALWVLDPARHRFATLPTPDDVVVSRAGHIFVNTLGDNAIHELDAQGHQVSMIGGIQYPQGIALDSADNLYYTEFNSGRIDRVVRSFVLDAPSVTRTGAGTYLICPVVRRAPGFSLPLTLDGGGNSSTSVLRVLQPGEDSSGALEVTTSQRSISIAVTAGEGASMLGMAQTVQLSP